MSIRRIPVWVRWTFLALALWCAWRFAIHPFFIGHINASGGQHDDSNRQLVAVEAQIGQAPTILQRIDSCRHVLDSCLAGFASSQDVDGLMGHLCAAGAGHALADLRAEPELGSLLNASRSPASTRSSQVCLDTIVVTLSARGGFFELGAWLDEIERRPDFCAWVSCRWNRGDEDQGIWFEGEATLLLVRQGGREPATGPLTGGM